MKTSTSWFDALAAYSPAAGLLATPARQGVVWSARLDNISPTPVRLNEWLLFDGPVATPGTVIYGEGFQMLAQTDGTWAEPRSIGRCPDASVYRITPDHGYHSIHNLLMYQTDDGWILLGFASCHRFGGEFRLYPDGRLQILMNTEGLSLLPGTHWESESLVVLTGSDRSQLLTEFSRHINRAHPALPTQSRATGWCSWYHYYAEVTREAIEENVSQMTERFPALEYVQIDDGYQSAMGDWLLPSDRFDGGLPPLLHAIRQAGREPALWVAPFIAEPGSQIFQQHPEWFIQDAEGKPLAAEKVTYGGWRCTPWYVLDGTLPAVQQHLQQLFHTLRHEYGIRYFKLDANFWGALHGGQFADRRATRIQAYRRGMAAILEGTGDDVFLLGCNAPFWPSLGLVHGMRVADDVERSGHRFRQITREIFSRSWQADRLWQLDPDCLCLLDIPGQSASPAEYSFHAAMMAACGGMLLLGDRLADLGPHQQQVVAGLQKLAQAKAPAARFADDRYLLGQLPWEQGTLCCYFNWQADPVTLELPPASQDFWSQEPLPQGEWTLPGYGGLVIWHPGSV